MPRKTKLTDEEKEKGFKEYEQMNADGTKTVVREYGWYQKEGNKLSKSGKVSKIKTDSFEIEAKPGGRGLSLTQEQIERLEYAFSCGCPVTEACLFAKINRATFYNYCNRNEGFFDRMNELRDKPVLQARMTIKKNLDDPKVAQWLLERKAKKEFSAQVDITSTNTNINTVVDLKKLKEIRELLDE